MNLYDIAVTYADKGIPTTPVKDKRPFLPGWQKLTSEEITSDIHRLNWGRANGIGVLLGEPSGIICLDVDILKQDEKLSHIIDTLDGLLPPIFCARTGNPEKPPARFFKFQGEAAQKFNSIGVEILSTGNQVVVPPSKHPSGVFYEWVNRPLDEIDPDDLPTLPMKIIKFLEEQNNKYDEGNTVSANGKFDPKTMELQEAPGRCKHNSYNYLSHYGVKLFYLGYDLESMTSELLEEDWKINKDSDFTFFNCPSRKEFAKADSTTRARSINAKSFALDIYKKHWIKRADKEENDFFKEELQSGFTWRDEKNPSKYVRKTEKLYHFLNYHHKPVYCPGHKCIMFWNGKHYEEKHTDWALAYAQKHFKNPTVVNQGERVRFLDFIRSQEQASISDFSLRDSGKVNFNNGIFDINEKRLRPHSPEHRMVNIIPHDLSGKGSVKTWNQLLKLITCDRPHLQLAIEEFIGYALSGASYKEFNKVLILDGGGANGKSTLVRIIEQLIGEKNSTSQSLIKINTERFAKYVLHNKLLNICSEEPKESFAETGPLKQLTGGDRIMMEPKGKDAFAHPNFAKFIISYNEAPYFPDKSGGMQRRLIIIPCDQDFEKHPDLKIKDPERRVIEDEAPFVLWKCLKAFMAVRERGHFTRVEEGEAKLKEMIVDSDPVLQFMTEEIEVTNSEDDYITSEDLWKHFEHFLGQPGKSKFSKRNFQRRVMGTLKAVKEYENDLLERRDKKIMANGTMRTKKVVFGIRVAKNSDFNPFTGQSYAP